MPFQDTDADTDADADTYRIYLLGFGVTPVCEGEVKIVSTGPSCRGMRPLRETGAFQLAIPDDIAGAFQVLNVTSPNVLLPGDEVRLTVRNVTCSPWYLRLLAAVGLRRPRAIRFTAALLGEAVETPLSRDEEAPTAPRAAPSLR